MEDSFKNDTLKISYHERFYTDYYYSDHSQWDANGDGKYAVDGQDSPAYKATIAVSRVSVSTVKEASQYYDKLVRYLTEFPDSKVKQALLLSNVAFSYNSLEIDGALYFENTNRTRAIVAPVYPEITRLYAKGTNGAIVNTLERQLNELQKGYNLVVHTGHGAVSSLTTEQDGKHNMTGVDAAGLRNNPYSVFLSCACQAGTFAADDSAGEKFVNNPSGGAIAYLGNTATGLGIAGGMQLIDELLRYVAANEHPLLGDAYLTAHNRLPEHDDFTPDLLPISLPVIDIHSYEWTQKTVVLLGDMLIPVYRDSLIEAPKITVSQETVDGKWQLVVSTNPAVNAKARILVEDTYYEVQLSEGKARLEPAAAGDYAIGLAMPGYQSVLIRSN